MHVLRSLTKREIEGIHLFCWYSWQSNCIEREVKSSSGIDSQCFAKFATSRSEAIFSGKRPSSARHMRFAADLFTPNKCLQNSKCTCSIGHFSQLSKICLSCIFHTSAPYNNIGVTYASKSFKAMFTGICLSLIFRFKAKHARLVFWLRYSIELLKDPAAFIVSPRYVNSQMLLTKYHPMWKMSFLLTLFFFWKVMQFVFSMLTFIFHVSQNLSKISEDLWRPVADFDKIRMSSA